MEKILLASWFIIAHSSVSIAFENKCLGRFCLGDDLLKHAEILNNSEELKKDFDKVILNEPIGCKITRRVYLYEDGPQNESYILIFDSESNNTPNLQLIQRRYIFPLPFKFTNMTDKLTGDAKLLLPLSDNVTDSYIKKYKIKEDEIVVTKESKFRADRGGVQLEIFFNPDKFKYVFEQLRSDKLSPGNGNVCAGVDLIPK